jgi:hypothetical protein
MALLPNMPLQYLSNELVLPSLGFVAIVNFYNWIRVFEEILGLWISF